MKRPYLGDAPQSIPRWHGWGFGIANMGSDVIRLIEMILWGGLGMVDHDTTVRYTANSGADLILKQFSHPAIFQNSLT